MILVTVAVVGLAALGIVVWQLADGGAGRITDGLAGLVDSSGSDGSDPEPATNGAVEPPVPTDPSDPGVDGPGVAGDAAVPNGVAFGFDSAGRSSEVPGMGAGIGTGDQDALVVVEIYQDFMCPHCAAFEHEAGALIATRTVAGEVRVVRYPMTLDSFGEPSVLAANAYACAADVGAGHEMNAELYRLAGTQWDVEALVALARPLVDDEAAFTECLSALAFGDWVESMDKASDDRGVIGTPTVFVDGLPVQPDGGGWEGALDDAIDSALN